MVRNLNRRQQQRIAAEEQLALEAQEVREREEREAQERLEEENEQERNRAAEIERQEQEAQRQREARARDEMEEQARRETRERDAQNQKDPKFAKWTRDLFKGRKGDNWLAHYAEVLRVMQGKGTPYQRFLYLRDTIAPQVQALVCVLKGADRTFADGEFPTVEKVNEYAQEHFKGASRSAVETFNDWLTVFAGLKQDDSETIVSFINRLKEKCQEFTDSQLYVQASVEDRRAWYMNIEANCLHALSSRCKPHWNLRYGELLDAKQQLKGEDFRYSFETLARDFIHEEMKSRYQGKNKAPDDGKEKRPQKEAICHFDGKCLRKNCKFKHNKQDGPIASKQKESFAKKRQAEEEEKSYGKHADDLCQHRRPKVGPRACWTCDPTKRPEKFQKKD